MELLKQQVMSRQHEYKVLYFHDELEGNPGKIARSGLFQDCIILPLYPIIGIESNGSVPSPDSSKREVVPSIKRIEIFWELTMDSGL